MTIRFPHFQPQYAPIIRAVPGALIVIIGIIGLLIPDQIKVVQDAGGSPPTHPVHVWSGYTIGLILAGVLAVAGSFIKEIREQENDPGHLNQEQFLEHYVAALTSTLEPFPLLPAANEAGKKEYIGNILKNICTIAEIYKSDNVNHQHSLNACLYLAIDSSAATPQQLGSAAKFMDKGRHTYDTFLVLKQWAFEKTIAGKGAKGISPCVAIGFTLPVDSEEDYTLFGAPLAFKTKQVTEIADINNRNPVPTLPGTSHRPIQREVVSFFAVRESYRSFVSLPIVIGDKALGVVSVQSKRKNFCNVNEDDGRKMLKAMEPFLMILGLVVSHYP